MKKNVLFCLLIILGTTTFAQTENSITVSGVKNTGIIKLFNAAGKLTLSKQVNAQTLLLDISAYPAGQYYLDYETAGKHYAKPLIKQ